jgi:hypothetical protein
MRSGGIVFLAPDENVANESAAICLAIEGHMAGRAAKERMALAMTCHYVGRELGWSCKKPRPSPVKPDC